MIYPFCRYRDALDAIHMLNTNSLPISSCKAVALLLTDQRVIFLESWRKAIRRLPHAAGLNVVALNDHIPKLLDELVSTLSRTSGNGTSQSARPVSATEHGLQRLHEGFNIEEVISEYNALRLCIHDLAEKHSVMLQGEPFRVINTMLDNAISTAVQTYAMQSAAQIQRRREDYLAFVAHDLRTPLNSLTLAADLLDHHIANVSSPEVIASVMVKLRRNLHLMNSLVEEVVKENINVECQVGIHVDSKLLALRPLVQSVIDNLHIIADQGQTMLTNEIAEGFTVVADGLLLRRVFQNLIANAIRFTPSGIVRICAYYNDRGTEAVCEVTDNGLGIAEDRLDAVFEKLESDSLESGRGLGLSATKLLVQAHGGTISAQSTLGSGTTFQFTLPLNSAKADNEQTRFSF